MSYCRWSSDNWKCDLYCYEGSDGFVTHIANRKLVKEAPLVPDLLTTDNETWSKAHGSQMDFLKYAKRKDIGLPYDGQTFVDESLEDFLERVKHLKETGYCVPDYVIKSIEDERKGKLCQP